jgi:hypothetical protein
MKFTLEAIKEFGLPFTVSFHFAVLFYIQGINDSLHLYLLPSFSYEFA